MKPKGRAQTTSAELKDEHRTFLEQRDQLLRDGDFSSYLLMFGSHERFQPFLDIIPRLSSAQYWTFLRDVWTSVEVVHQHMQQWLRLLQSKRPNREALMTPEEHMALARLPDEIEIWRGVGDKAGIMGLSWTLDKERAVFFSTYACDGRRQILTPRSHSVTPIVVAATCRKADVLAHFIERRESEIVVNPKHVKVQSMSPGRVDGP